MEENLVHSSLDFLKVLERFTLEMKCYTNVVTVVANKI